MYAYKYVLPVTILKLITVTHFSGETDYDEPAPKRPVGETEGKYGYIVYYYLLHAYIIICMWLGLGKPDGLCVQVKCGFTVLCASCLKWRSGSPQKL